MSYITEYFAIYSNVVKQYCFTFDFFYNKQINYLIKYMRKYIFYINLKVGLYNSIIFIISSKLYILLLSFFDSDWRFDLKIVLGNL